jgi:hypothetical protein
MNKSPDLSRVAWVKSSYSGNGGGNCVEIAPGVPGVVPVRDSKDPARGALVFGTAAWDALVRGIAGGDLA